MFQNGFIRSIFALVVAIAITIPCISYSADNNDKTLTIGSTAPGIDITHWVSNGNGKFNEVTKFEKGKVYVVEFWATWCRPCIQSMPHLSALQNRFAKKGVQVISISDEDIATVNSFLNRQVPEFADEKTYAELTASYCLTTDPDGSVQRDYMEAANLKGIPTSFIVGKDGHIEWIGHPLELEQPLEQIVAGSWDRATAKKDYDAEQQLQIAMQEIGGMLREGDSEKAIAMIERTIKSMPAGGQRMQLKNIRLQLYMQMEDQENSIIAFDDMVAEGKHDVELLNAISWGIVEAGMSGANLGKNLINAARTASNHAAKLSPDDAAVLDTQSHLAYLQGELDEAIKIQRTAIENADASIRSELKAFLNKLQQEKAKISAAEGSKK